MQKVKQSVHIDLDEDPVKLILSYQTSDTSSQSDIKGAVKLTSKS